MTALFSSTLIVHLRHPTSRSRSLVIAPDTNRLACWRTWVPTIVLRSVNPAGAT
jgi:hypothetical protein